VRLRLVDVDAEEDLEVVRIRLEERPLVALEVRSNAPAERRERLVAPRVQQLDQDVRVAVRLRIRAVVGMERMRRVARRVEAEQAHHRVSYAGDGHRSDVTSCGHSSGSRPCRLKSASEIRSSPKPTHAVWAGSPFGCRRSKIEEKWSRW